MFVLSNLDICYWNYSYSGLNNVRLPTLQLKLLQYSKFQMAKLQSLLRSKLTTIQYKVIHKDNLGHHC